MAIWRNQTKHNQNISVIIIIIININQLYIIKTFKNADNLKKFHCLL